MHRKTREIPMGHIVGLVTLAACLAAILSLLFSLASPAAANASTVRPSWNGHGVWNSDTEPTCPWLDVHHIGLIRWDNGNTYYAECLPDGPHGEYDWQLVSL